MKYQLEYVVSGCGRMQLFHKDMLTNPDIFKVYRDGVMQIPSIVESDLQKYSKHSDPILSMLYNAFTEKNFTIPTKGFQLYDWLKSDSVYADSGGLQIVTTGKSITPEIKQKIYQTQTNADFAMCFDVIPLTSTSLIQNSNERTNVGNKVFEDHKFAESAMATAKNIKEQIDFFKKNEAKTKVIIIVQGNTAQDMKFFYDTIASQLKEEDYNYVGGVAIADTCMGNGELESIKMLHAAHLIAKDCHESVKTHIHFLGIGSLYRLRPIIYLVRSGFLKTFERISYDSTSHTSCFDMGLFKWNGTCKSYGTHRTPLAEKVFYEVYDYFKDVFDKVVTFDEYKKVIFGPNGDSALKFTSLRNNAASLGTNSHIAGMWVKEAHSYYQIQNFMKRAEDIWGEEKNNDPVSFLLDVRDEQDINEWYENFISHVSSSGIRRRSDISTLSLL